MLERYGSVRLCVGVCTCVTMDNIVHVVLYYPSLARQREGLARETNIIHGVTDVTSTNEPRLRENTHTAAYVGTTSTAACVGISLAGQTNFSHGGGEKLVCPQISTSSALYCEG